MRWPPSKLGGAASSRSLANPSGRSFPPCRKCSDGTEASRQKRRVRNSPALDSPRITALRLLGFLKNPLFGDDYDNPGLGDVIFLPILLEVVPDLGVLRDLDVAVNDGAADP